MKNDIGTSLSTKHSFRCKYKLSQTQKITRSMGCWIFAFLKCHFEPAICILLKL